MATRSEGYGLLKEIYSVSDASVELWGEDQERWMVVEENAELLDVVAKHQRGRASKVDVAEEAADSILVAVHACRVEGVPLSMLWKHLMNKLGRAKTRVMEARR